MKKNYKVYCHTNIITGKQYVGMTKLTMSRRCGTNGNGYVQCVAFYRSIEKYGWDNFETKVLFDELSFDEASQIERDTIEILNSMSPNGYNLQSGGGVNRTFSEESRIKMSNSQRGKTLTQEHRDRIGMVHRGKIVSEETREKLRQANLGKILTDEHKENIRKGLLNNTNRKFANKPITQLTLTGEYIRDWESASEASRELGLNRRSIAKCRDGSQKTSGGFKWVAN